MRNKAYLAEWRAHLLARLAQLPLLFGQFSGAGLLLEPFEGVWDEKGALGDDLDRDLPVQRDIMGQVHRGHSSGARSR